MLVNTHGSVDRSKIGGSALVMVLGKTLGSKVETIRGSTDVLSGVNGDGKPD